MVGKSLKKWWPVFVLPTLAAFIIGFLWPFIWGIYLSFCKFSTVKDVVWVGLSNYQKIFIGGDGLADFLEVCFSGWLGAAAPAESFLRCFLPLFEWGGIIST